MIKRAIGIETNLIPYEYQNRKDIGIFLVFISGDKPTQEKKAQLIARCCELIKDIKANQSCQPCEYGKYTENKRKNWRGIK